MSGNKKYYALYDSLLESFKAGYANESYEESMEDGIGYIHSLAVNDEEYNEMNRLAAKDILEEYNFSIVEITERGYEKILNSNVERNVYLEKEEFSFIDEKTEDLQNQLQNLRSIHFWKRNQMLAVRDKDELEIEKSHKSIIYAFEQSDKLNIPFKIQNQVLHAAEVDHSFGVIESDLKAGLIASNKQLEKENTAKDNFEKRDNIQFLVENTGLDSETIEQYIGFMKDYEKYYNSSYYSSSVEEDLNTNVALEIAHNNNQVEYELEQKGLSEDVINVFHDEAKQQVEKELAVNNKSIEKLNTQKSMQLER